MWTARSAVSQRDRRGLRPTLSFLIDASPCASSAGICHEPRAYSPHRYGRTPAQSPLDASALFISFSISCMFFSALTRVDIVLFRPRCWKALRRKKISEMKLGVVLSTGSQPRACGRVCSYNSPSIEVYASTSSLVAFMRVSSLMLMRELLR